MSFAVKGKVAAATNGVTLIKFLATFNPARSPPAAPEAAPPPRLFLIVLSGLSLIEVNPRYPLSFNVLFINPKSLSWVIRPKSVRSNFSSIRLISEVFL
jgi:hypothetical protein